MTLTNVRGNIISTDFWLNLNLQGGIFASGVSGTIAQGESFDLLMVTDQFEVVTRLGAAVTGDSTVLIFEDTVVSDNGTPATFVNGNRSSQNTTTVTMFTEPTIDTEPADLGDLIAGIVIPAGQRVLITDFTPGIFKKNTNYLFRITNDSPGPDTLSIFVETSEVIKGFFGNFGDAK